MISGGNKKSVPCNLSGDVNIMFLIITYLINNFNCYCRMYAIAAVPAVLKPSDLARDVGKRTDGLTIVL